MGLAGAIEGAERSSVEVLSLPVLSAAAAGEVAEEVLALARHWTPRDPIAPFFTLGAAAYLDAAHGLEPYAALACRTNPLLEARFRDLFERLAACLEETLRAPVMVTRRLALPGFHIYQPFFAFSGAVASLHWDRQQVLLPWPEGPVPEAVQSLTLPLALPGGAAGLDLWAWRYPAEAAARAAVLRDPGPPDRSLDYDPGVAVLHDGQNLHRARLMPEQSPASPRISLQAHMAWSVGRWELYW